MTKLFLPLLALICTVLLNNANAQIIELGPPLDNDEILIGHVGEIDGSCYIRTKKNKFDESKYRWAVLDETMNLQEAVDIKIEYNDSKHEIESIQIFDGKVLAFTSVYLKKQKQKAYYFGYLNPETLLLEGDMVLIAQVKTKTFLNRARMEIRKDEDHLMVFIYPPYNKEHYLVDLLVFENGSDLPKAHSFEYLIPRGHQIEQVELKDKLYFRTKYFVEMPKDPLNRLEADKLVYEWHIFSFDLETNQFEDFKYDLGEHMVRNNKLIIDDEGNVHVMGFYSQKGIRGAKGMFFCKIFVQDGELNVITSKEPFSNDFILELYDENKQEKLLKKEERKDEEIQIPGAVIHRLILNDEGGLTMVGEIHFVIKPDDNQSRIGTNGRIGTNERGLSTDYYYRDIFAVAINAEGERMWLSRIPKKQLAICWNAEECSKPFRSFAMFVMEKELHFFYNETCSNLEEERAGDMSDSQKDNCVIKATMSSDGSVTREKFIGFPEGTALKSTFYRQLNEKELLLFLTHSKYIQFVKLVF